MSQAIKIEDILQSSRVSLFSFDKNIPLDEWLKCPSCGTGLRPICILTNGSDQRIRYGLCEKCGYMGYMDRPTKEWMVDFYSKDWDRAFPKTISDIRNGTIMPGKGIKPSRYLAASLIERINPNKEKPVCEIGSGYGEVLKYFKDAGFKTIIGVENSKHRAELVKEALGFDILHGGFGDREIHEQLLKYRPIGLFFSHHVLEHVYDPSEVISKIHSLQEEGDYLILSLPNSDGEHINYALLYLVHLHSFTKESLELLLNKNGYEIVEDNSPDNSNIIIAARKTRNPQAKFQIKQGYFDSVSKRIIKGLALERMKEGELNKLYWEQGSEIDKAKLLPVYSSQFLQKIDWYFKNKIAYIKSRLLKRFTSGYTMFVAPVKTKGESFEIIFPDKIKFLIK